MGTLIETDAWVKWNITAMRLGALSWRARRMHMMAGDMQRILRDMLERPDFETQCEDDMQKLITEIATLHAFSKAVLDVYRKKPATA